MTHLPGSCHPALAAKVAPFKYAGTKLSSCTVEGSHRLAISSSQLQPALVAAFARQIKNDQDKVSNNLAGNRGCLTCPRAERRGRYNVVSSTIAQASFARKGTWQNLFPCWTSRTPRVTLHPFSLWSLNSYLLSHVGPWNRSLRPWIFS